PAAREHASQGPRCHADGQRDADAGAPIRLQRSADLRRQHWRVHADRLRIMNARSFTLIGVVAAWSSIATGVASRPPASPIADAAMRGDVAMVRTLIARRADVNAPQGDGMTALHWAADHGDSAMANALLRAKANVKAQTRIGAYTPLHIAARTGNPAVVRPLLSGGRDGKAPTTSGATALPLAAAAGNADVVKALLAKGADPNARE